MAAITASGTSRDLRNTAGRRDLEILVETSAKVYESSLVVPDATSGYLHSATNTAAAHRQLVLMCQETITGDGSTVYAKCITGVEAKFALTATAVTALRQGCNMYVKNNNEVTTATDAGTAAKRYLVGHLVEFITTATGWVMLGIEGPGGDV